MPLGGSVLSGHACETWHRSRDGPAVRGTHRRPRVREISPSPEGSNIFDTESVPEWQVQNTLDPLLEEITHCYVDDDDLTARLTTLFEVPPRSQASKGQMQRNRPSWRSFSLQPMRLCLSSLGM